LYSIYPIDFIPNESVLTIEKFLSNSNKLMQLNNRKKNKLYPLLPPRIKPLLVPVIV
jgi:hypothetical protein